MVSNSSNEQLRIILNFFKISLMRRRVFLLKTGLLGLSSLLPFGAIAMQKRPSWEALVEWARWAPSVHNLQPYRLKVVSEEKALLCYDPKFLLPVGDPKSEFSTAVMGVFVESLSIAAAPHGFKVEMSDILQTISTEYVDVQPFAQLHLIPSFSKESLAPELMLKRRTSRTDYNGEPLSSGTVERCAAIVSNFGGKLFHTNDSEKVDMLVKINQATLFEDLSHGPMREELDGLFRYSKKEAEESRTGLWTRCMGFPGKLVISVFRHHERWTKGTRKKMLSSYYGNTYKGTASIMWIQHPWSKPEDQVNFGRILCRIWLQLAKDDAYMHPFGSLITNPTAFDSLSKSLELDENSDAPLAFICRAGYSKEPPRSYRINTTDILLP